MLTTPKKLFPELEGLRARLGSAETPLFIEVRPRPDSMPDDCTFDVDQQIAEKRGSVLYGWMIWLWPGVMAEAVFHAVWVSPKGLLRDVNRKQDGEDRILFIPAPSLIYRGKRIPNVRMAILDHPLVHELISGTEKLTHEMDLHLGADYLGVVPSTPELEALAARNQQVDCLIRELIENNPSVQTYV